MANLRILYSNKASTLAGNSGALALTDIKSQTTFFTANTAQTLVSSTSLSGKVMVVAMLSTLNAITMSVVANSVTTTVTDTSTTNLTNSGLSTGGVKYVVAYLDLASATNTFSISFSANVGVCRILVGNYWEPKHNISYGISIGYNDSSTIDRLQGGDQYVMTGPRSKTMNFDLQYIADQDKYVLFDILRTNGKAVPVFASLFPNDSDKNLEQMYSIYGRFNTLPNMSYATYTMHASSLQLEEI